MMPSPTPSTSTTAANTYYQSPSGYLETAHGTGIDRTKTGLLLITIGYLSLWIPIVGIVGSIIQLVGAILVILGRKAFGKQHSRNVIWSVIIYVIGGGFSAGAFLALIFSIIANYRLNGTNPVPPPNSTSYFTPLFFDLILIAIAIQSIAHVLFTYALQKRNGRILLWCGYASIVAASSVEFLILINIRYLNTIPLIVPGIVFGYAYYLARERIVHGEIPVPLASPQGQAIPASKFESYSI